MKRITIIGLGLIGGSLGLALKESGAKEVVGWDVDRASGARARKMGAIDKDSKTLAGSVEGAELVIIATPLLAMPDVMQEIEPSLSPGCVVTDTGSTKATVMEWAETHLPGIDFIGGHPMAGKEVPGIEHAEAGLFKGATYCICPSPTASRKAFDTVVEVAESVGAGAYFPEPREHDTMVAATSHLPLLMSSALMTLASSSESWREVRRVASSGFAGATRLASTVPSMSTGICVTNREAIEHWIDRFVDELLGYKALLGAGEEEIRSGLEAARDARERWLAGEEPFSKEAGARVPGVGQQMSSMFLGEALVKRGRKLMDLYERGTKKGEDEERRSP